MDEVRANLRLQAATRQHIIMIPTSPAFSPLHSFLGGLMLASSVHHLLLQVGSVLGISGFFHSAVRSLVDFGSSGSSRSVANAASRSSSESNDHHSISPDDDLKRQSDHTQGFVSRYFINGLLIGGASLAAAQIPLQNLLGAPIFDAPDPGFHLGHGLSHGIFSLEAAKRFVPTAIHGILVGFGTKVSVFSGLDEISCCHCQLGSGCTSGHFLCGLSRVSPRSIVATATFFSVAVLTNLFAHPASNAKQLISQIPSTPSLGGILLLQIPALFYSIVVPWVVERAQKESSTKLQIKSVHDQAVKATALCIGVHFAFGLALTGMTRPSKVLGFLNLSPSRIANGQWDPSLALVAVGAILPSAISWFSVIKPKVVASQSQQRSRLTRNQYKETVESYGPLYSQSAPKWRIPSNNVIDWKLLVGSLIFGLGWGLTGLVC